MRWTKKNAPNQKKTAKKPASSPLLTALEPRLMYDGAAVTTAASLAHVTDSHAEVLPQVNVDASRDSAHAAEAKSSNENQHAVLFVDPRVKDSASLLANVAPGTEIVYLKQDQDGLQQMADYLAAHPGASSVQILAEGSEGNLWLGNTFLTSDNVQSHATELAKIGSNIEAGGDILVYACNTAKGNDGVAFVNSLAALTGHDIAASNNRTGVDGDWVLEVTTGSIEASSVLSSSAEAAYTHDLSTLTVTSNADSGAGSLRNLIGSAVAGDTITFNTGMTVTLSSGQLVINKNLTIEGDIDGNGTADVTINANYTSRALSITSGTVKLDGLIIENGFLTGAGGNRTAGVGGAGGDALGANISNAGTLTISHSTITQGVAAGGGGAGGDYYAGSAAGAGGGGGGFGSAFGGAGGTNFGGGTQAAASAGVGGRGAGYNNGSNFLGGAGGSGGISVGAAGVGSNYAGYSTGGSGGLATSGTRRIGGGGGGAGYDSAGGRGGNAAGGIFNTGTLTITTSSITNNIAAGGGGGGGSISGHGTAASGAGGNAIGAIWNSGGTVQMDSGTYSTLSTGNVGTGGNGGIGAVNGASGTSTGKISTTGGGTTVTNYTPPNSPPVDATSGGTTAFTEGNNVTSTPVAIDSGFTVTDADNTTLASATVSITGNFQSGQDVLAFTNDGSTMGNITASYTAGTGVLTLSSSGSTATVGQWQAALRSVTYTNSSDTPNTSNRTISFTTNDGTSNGNTATKTVSVTAVNDTPITTTTGGTTAFTEGNNVTSTPVVIDSGITVTDVDSATLASATVSITGGFQSSEDVLAFTNNPSTMGNITASYNSGTGVMTLTSAGATATKAQWQAALQSVTYTDTSDTPNTSNRTISFSVNDGNSNSATVTKTVSVTAVNDSPIATASSGTTAFTEGNNVTSTPVVIDSSITVTDVDSATLASATVSVTGGFQSSEDVLAFTNNPSTMGNITASYNSGTGVMTLTSAGATATKAQWQAALQSVTYTDSSDTPNTSNRTISFVVNDGNSNSAATTKTVSVTAVNDTPIATTTGGTTAFTEGDNVTSTPVVIDSGITVTDVDSTTLASATVSITGGFQSSEDVLAFTNNPSTMGNITASYNSGTGVLSLTSAGATATKAQWQAALQSITYTDTSDTPNTSNRTISFSVNDGNSNSATVTKTVSVTAVDDTPIVTTSSGSAGFSTGDNTTATPIAVDSGITVSDLDNPTLASATVKITGNFQSGQDVLAFTNSSSTMGNITASYDAATGVLSLTSAGATATKAQWQAALQSVTYTDTAVTPNGATRTVSFSVNDGTKTSAIATRDVTITITDQSPITTTSSGSASFVAADNAASTPVVIDGGITVSDTDNTTLASATVAITGNFQSGEDVLAFTNDGSTMGNITASYNAATGVLSLTSSGATATKAQWQAALQSVTYTDTAVTPNNATRTISFAANDGTKTGPAATRTVTVTDTDQTPIATTSGGSASFVAGDNATSTPVAVDSGITVSDLDNTTLASATVSITGNFQNGEDVLAFNNSNTTTYGNISATYNATTGVLSLSSAGATATKAQWQAALQAVTYTDTAVTPNNAARTISFSVSDGSKTSATVTRDVTVTDTDQSPLTTTSSGSASFVAGDNTTSTPVAVDSGITVSDLDNTTLASATVSITGNFHSGEDVLAFTNDGSTMGNITASYNATTGVLTLTSAGATATKAQWQAALQSVTYTDTAVTPNNATRTISFSVNDGTKNSAAATRTVTVTDTDQTPIATTSSGSASFVAGDNVASTPVAVDSGITVTDLDNTTLASATVSITGNFQSAEDVLGFTNNGSTMGNITASYNATTGVLTLTSAGATATKAQWQAALQSVTYTDTAVTPNNATRTISFAVSDGTKTSATVTRTVTVTDTDQTPIATTSSGSASFVAADNATSTPVAVDSGITVSDADNTTLASATVAITGNFQSGEDMLAFTNNPATMGNISASYNSSTGIMTLSSAGATATKAQWQAALQSVTYTDTAITPNSATRTVSFSISDGTKTSATATRTVTVTDTDQTPITTTSSGSASFVAADNATSTPVVIDGGVTVADLDNTTLASATVSVTGNFHSGEDVLAFTNNGSTMGNITASYNATTGVLTLTSAGATATKAQWQAALQSVTYTDTAVTPNNATRTISFSVNDGTKNSAAATRTVTVTDTDQTPIATTSSGSASFVAGDNTTSTPVAVDSGITVSDLDNTTLASATVSVTGNFHGGEDVLAFTNNGSTMGNITASYNATTGVLTLTSAGATATKAQWQAALQSVTYTNTAVTPNNATRTIIFVVNDGSKNSTAATRTVTVTDTDQTPIATTSSGSASFVAGDNTTSTPIAVDSGITVSDLDNTTLASATVSVTGNFHSGEDVLAFTNNGSTMGNITASYNATTGVLTLTSAGATATKAQWQAALQSVTYTDTAVTPNNATRTISFSVNDGTKNSAAATRTVTVTDTDQTPIATTSSGSASFVAGDNTTSTPVAVDSGITVSDLDNTTLASATVSVTGNFHSGEDVLAFTNNGSTMGNITASYNATTGVLTLTSAGATATKAQWQAALQSVTYTDTAVTPNNATRTISFVVNDGSKNSAAATRTVTVTDTDQTPIAITSSGSASFVAGDNTTSTPVAVDSGITVSDLDNTTLASATVSITGNFHSGEDVLGFTNNGSTMGNITASYNATTGVLTLTSAGATATKAQWQAALQSVTYTDTAVTPNNTTRTISFVVNDGTKNSAAATRTVTVTDTDQTPIATTSSGSASFVAGDNVASTLVVIDGGVTVSDLDNTTLASATVSVTGNFHSGEDVLGFTNNGSTMGNITASYNAATGVLTLTSAGATATKAQWQAALQSVTYTDTAVTPNNATRTISFAVSDGTKTSATVTRNVTVTDTDQTPIVTTSGGSSGFVESTSGPTPPVTVDGSITVSDRDNTTLASATVAIGSGFKSSEDSLAFINTSSASFGNITASYNSSTGVLTLTSAGATATTAQWQAALQAVTYGNSAITPDTTDRSISFTVNDGTKTSVVATKTMTVEAINHAPTITAPASLTILEDTSDVIAGISFTDVDNNGGLETVTLTVSSGTLNGTSGGGVTATGSGTGTLTLSGTVANINTFIAGSNLSFVSALNSTADVNLHVGINDNGNTGSGGALTAATDVTLHVTAINHAPTITAPGSITAIEDTSKALTGISFNDVDGNGATETVTLTVGSGTISGISTSGVTVSGSGTATFTLTGSLTNINAYLAASQATFLNAQDNTSSITLHVDVNDNGNSGVGGVKSSSTDVTLNITAVNDAPVNHVPGGQNVLQEGSLVFSAGNSNSISVSDVDANGGQEQVTLTVSHGTVTLSGTTGLSFVTGTGSGDSTVTFTGTLADINNALAGLTYKPTAGYYGSDTLSVSTNDQGNTGIGGAQTSNALVAITVTPIAAEITAVSSTTANGTYKIGDTVYVDVVFTQNVTVDTSGGTPTLLLETGTVDHSATYVSGSGGNVLVFKYVVQNGDQSPDLNYQSTGALSLNGGTIRDSANLDSVLTLPATNSGASLGGAKNIVIDGVPPTVTSVSVPANADYIAGQNLDFTVNYSENVTVDTTNGTPRLAITLDTGGTVYADYTGGSGTSALTFRFTVQPGELDTNGITVGSTLDTNGSTVRDAAGNDAVTTLNNVASTNGVLVDSIPPTVTSVNVPADGTYGVGQTLTFTVNVSENVLVDTSGGTPYLNITLDNGGTVHANYVGGSGTNALTFSYTIVTGEADSNGITVGSSIVTNGGTIKDVATNSAVLGLNSVGSTSHVLVDSIPPTVSSINIAGPALNNASSETFTVTFDKPVNGVDATDFTVVGSGTASGTVSVVSGSGTTWTVTVGSVTGDGTLRLDLNNAGDPITDNYGNTLVQAHAGDQSYTVDHTPPAAISMTVPADGTYIAGQNLDFSVTYSENVTVDTSGGTPRLAITLDTGGTVYANYVSGSGTGTLTFRYTVGTGVEDLTGIVAGTSLDANGGTIRDAATNNANLAINAVEPSTANIDVDGIAPTVNSVSVPADGDYHAGQVLTFTVNTSETVNVDTSGGTPRIALDIGGTTQYATYVSGSGTSALTFQYTVQAGDNDGNGIGVGSSVDLNGGHMTDAPGNAFVTALNSVASTANVDIDTTAPTVSSINRVESQLTNAATLHYTVTFSEDVTGVDASDFTLVGTGTAAGSITGVTQVDAHTYTVTVGTVSGTGTLELNLNNSGTGIADRASNAIAAGFAGQTYNVDRDPPTVNTVSVPADGDYHAGQVLSFTVSTSEAVNVDTTGGTPRIALDIGGTTQYATYVSGSGTSALVFQYTVQAGDNDGNGISVSSSIDTNGGTLRDPAGNNTVTTLNSVASTANVEVDTTPPSPVSINRVESQLTNAATLHYTVTFSEDVTGVDASDFTLASSGTAAGSISGVTQVDAHTYTVTVSSVSGTGTLQLNLNGSGTGIIDRASNAITGGLTGQSYNVDRDPPTANITRTDASPTAKDTVHFTVTFDEPVSGVSAGDFHVIASGNAQGSISGVQQIDSKTYVVTVNHLQGDGNLGLNLTAAGSGIQDVAGNAMVANVTGQSYELRPLFFHLMPTQAADQGHGRGDLPAADPSDTIVLNALNGLGNHGSALDNINLGQRDNSLRDNTSDYVVFGENPGQGLRAQASIGQVTVRPGQVLLFRLPKGTFSTGDTSARLSLNVRQANGQPLPAWLHFDPLLGTLSGKVPATMSHLVLDISAQDVDGHTVHSVLELGTPTATAEAHAPAQGKPALNRQFAQFGHGATAARNQDLLQHLRHAAAPQADTESVKGA